LACVLTRRSLAALTAMVALSGCLGNREDGEVVIRVDDHVVTVAAFEELASHLAATTTLPPDGDSRRQYVLDVLLAREALLLEAEATGLLQSPAAAMALGQRERELVTDLLYEREVEDRAVPTQEQLDSLYVAWGSGEAVRARHILLAGEEEAEAVLEELAGGASFEELARTRSVHAMSARVGGAMGDLRREQLLPEMRDPVWSAEAGQVLPLIRTRMGFHVVKLVEHRHRSLQEMGAELRGEMGRDLRRRREREFGGQLRTRYGCQWRPAIAAAVIERRLTAEVASDTAIAQWEGGALSVGEFVQYVRKHGHRETEIDTSEARELGEAASLRGLLWTLGQERRVADETEPSRTLRLARAELVGEVLFAQVAAGVDVSAPARRRAFEAHRANYRLPPTLRVREILVDGRQLADSLAALIRAGADMAELASRYSERLWARPKGGDIGEISEGAPAYAKMARVARNVPPGQLIGPISSHGGFSILRVTSRREGEQGTFEEAGAVVAEDLRNRAMDAFIDSLRGRYADRIQVYEEALQQTLGAAAP